MAYEPVARRTRLRRAENFERIREMNKKARISARTEMMKNKRSLHNLEDEEEVVAEEDDDDDVVEVIDREEFERGRTFKVDFRNHDLGFEENHNVGQISHDDDIKHEYDDHDGGNNLEEKTLDGEGDSSDVEILGSGYDFDVHVDVDDVVVDDMDDDDDDDDEDDDMDVPSCSYKVEKKAEENPVKHEDSEFSSSEEVDEDDRVFKVDDPETSIARYDDDDDDDDVDDNDDAKPELPEKYGNFSTPVDVEYSVISSEEEEEEELGVNPNPNRKRRKDNNGEKKLSPCLKKRKKVKVFKKNELHKIIINSMSENGGDRYLEKYMPSLSEVDLPLKFKFGIIEEKTEQETEDDILWKEMEFALGACNVGIDYNCGDNDRSNVIPSDNPIEQAKLCKKGNHHLFLDDEIGLRCKFCSCVSIESKYLFLDFNENPFRKRDNRGYGRVLENNGDIPSVDYDRLQNHGSDSIACGTRETYGTVWDLIPGTKEVLYPHQREGFEFIWKNVAGGIQISELRNPTEFGGGCIICHAPGTGKTRLAIVFLQSYLKQYPKSRPVIIAPTSVLLTWEEEFLRWKTGIPFLNMNNNEFSGEENPMLLKLVGNKKDLETVRMVKLFTWVNGKGVLGISYTLFEKKTSGGGNEKIWENLPKKAGIFFLDEGHTPRNENSRIWKALSNVTERKKIILSGTPFQNNFHELYHTITLARKEFVNPHLAKRQRGNVVQDVAKYSLLGFSTSPCLGSVNGKRSFQYGSTVSGEDESRETEKLKARIKPFVHVYKGGILKEKLRGLLDFVLLLKPSELQKKCFKRIETCRNSFERDCSVSMTSIHPSNLLKNFPDFLDEKMKHLLEEHEANLDAGVKTRFLFELIKLCKGEKVLVFSQYICPLHFLGSLLEKRFNWNVGNEFLYMDGKQDHKTRQNSIRFFNDPRSEARVLLASTKACCEGIHLVGASRVVLLDVVWNPSVERQAISRAYRLGQTKNVYVYHLLSGDEECDKYYRKESKDRVSQLVFSPSETETIGLPKMNHTAKSSGLEDQVLVC